MTDRYTQAVCAAHVRNVRIPDLRWTFGASDGAAAWDYVTDGLTTPIGDARAVRMRQTQNGATSNVEIHIAPSATTWRWFTDCRDPA